MSENKLLQRYKLKRNPFAPELQRELCPQCEEELSLYAKVEGFGQQVQHIQNWFARPENLAEPAFILVCGPEGSGRSSVVNYIIYCFGQAKRLNADKVSPITVPIKNHDDMEPIQEALEKLYTCLEEKPGVNLEKDFPKLDDLFMNHVIERSEPSNKRICKLVFRRTKPILGDEIVIVLDNIRTYEQVDSSAQVFEDAPLILFTTSNEEVYKGFTSSKIHGFPVKLSNLTLEDVKEFIVQRWLACSGDEQHPFPESGIQRVFEIESGKTWTFQAVVNILAEIFTTHLEELKKAEMPSKPISVPPVLSEKMVLTAYQYAMRVSEL
jgi:hypothetical protein